MSHNVPVKLTFTFRLASEKGPVNFPWFFSKVVNSQCQVAVLPDGHDQLPLRNLTFAVIPTKVNGTDKYKHMLTALTCKIKYFTWWTCFHQKYN
jgi:hypothetical protein